jgi:hypothetical protein
VSIPTQTNLQQAVVKMTQFVQHMELTLTPIHADTNFGLDQEANDKKMSNFGEEQS